jgi:hypothetical protein
MDTYRTFTRSANNFEEFSSAEKVEVDTGLTLAEARDNCQTFNNNRSEAEKAAGTKMEFEME